VASLPDRTVCKTLSVSQPSVKMKPVKLLTKKVALRGLNALYSSGGCVPACKNKGCLAFQVAT